jgi:GT2 family glycosyltransferase
MADRPLVYIVVLNYNGLEDTLACLASLKRASYPNFRVAVVDNCSSDGSEAAIRSRHPELELIQTGKNLGYAGGNNAGIRRALEQKADYVCLLNNDTEVDPDFLGPLVEWMERDRDTGIAGPKVCDFRDRNIIQATGSKANLFLGKFWQINQGKPRDQVRGVLEVDYVAGACLLIRRSLIEEIGPVPEEYFLFFEETEWCLKARRAGRKVVCVCDSLIYHQGSKTIGKISGTQEYYMTRNQIIFEKRNATPAQWAVFWLHRRYRMALSRLKGRAKGGMNPDMLRGFRDGMRYRNDG